MFVKQELRERRALQIERQIDNIERIIREVEKTVQLGTPLSDNYYRLISLLPNKVKSVIAKETQMAKLKNMLKEEVGTLNNRKKDVLNEDTAINALVNKLFNSVDTNNSESLIFIKKIQSLIDEGKLLITTSKTANAAVYSSDFNYISIGKQYIDVENYTVLAHELGHLLHDQVLNNEILNNFEEIVANARTISTNNGKVQECSQIFKEIRRTANEQARKDLTMTLKEKIQEFISLQKYFISEGVNPIKAVKMAKEQIYAGKISQNYNKLVNSGKETKYSPELADIIDAVFEGKSKDNNGKGFAITRGHGADYFSTIDNQFSEMIADFTALKVTGKQYDLQLLRDMFGNEFYNMLDTTFNYFIQTDLVEEQEETIEHIDIPEQIKYSHETQELIDQVDIILAQQMQDFSQPSSTLSTNSGKKKIVIK